MSAKYEPVIGLEVHVQLNTLTKLFCPCSARSFGAPPNTNICPVCTGQPGVLPVLNRAAVEKAIQTAAALGLTLHARSVFARKNYYYPDLPKGYQISQYDQPYSTDGRLDLPDGKTIGIERIHMEEDAGKLLHDIGSEELDHSLVDYNRSSVPLLEIVSKPDLRSADEAYAYLTELKAVVQAVGSSNCDMEKGEMRCDANVSIRPLGRAAFGTRAEIKNLNSFRAVRDAILYEIERQAEVLDSGGAVVQETRLWDEKIQKTRSMRSKEEAHDYRYFPEPDLVPLEPSPAWIEELRAALPELPRARRARFMDEYALTDYDAGVLNQSRALADYYERGLAAAKVTPKGLANFVTTDFLGLLNKDAKDPGDAPVPAERLAELVAMVESGKISVKQGKEVFPKMWETGEAAPALIEKMGGGQVSDAAQIAAWAEDAIAKNAAAADDVRGGNDKAIGRLVGHVMKLSKGKANPGLVNDILKQKLGV